MGLIKRIFQKNNTAFGSRHAARERLKLVLVQDRMNLDGDRLEGLKNDLIAVIEKHLDIDKESMDITFCREGDSVAVIANIPMRSETPHAV